MVTRCVDQLDSLRESLIEMPEVAGIYETIHTGVADAVKYDSIRHIGGEPALYEKVQDYTFEVGPPVFLSTNSEGMEVLQGNRKSSYCKKSYRLSILAIPNY